MTNQLMNLIQTDPLASHMMGALLINDPRDDPRELLDPMIELFTDRADTPELIDRMIALFAEIADDIHTLSALRLEYSICPMHFCDYAICFDDDDNECRTIRLLFPRHDS